MSDEQLPENPPPASTPPAAAAQQPPANVLDTPEVRAAIAQAEERARNATWKQARETLGKKNGGTPSNATEATSAPQPTQPAGDDFARTRTYERTLAKFDLTDEAMALLDEDFARAKPADVAQWVTSRLTAFGARPRGATPTPTPTPSTQTTPPPAPVTPPSGPPVTANGAPSNPARVTDDVPLINRSAADQQAYIAQHGPIAFANRVAEEAQKHNVRFRMRS